MQSQCPFCDTPVQCADRQTASALTQQVCTQCSANLVFITQKEGEYPATATEPASFTEGTQRARLLGISASAIFCVVAYAVVVTQSNSAFLLIQQTATGQKVQGAAEEVNPATPYLNAGRELLAENEFRKALEQFRMAVAKAPSSVPAHLLRGEAARKIGELDEALQAYRMAVELSPSSENYFELGMMAHRIGEMRLAVDSLKASLARRQFVERVRDRFFGFWVNGATLPDYLFIVLVESGDRNEALAFARSQGWVRKVESYCTYRGSEYVRNTTTALLGMLIEPVATYCLGQEAGLLRMEGQVRLARLIAMEVKRNAPVNDVQHVRKASDHFLLHFLPPHEVPKRAEWLLIVGNRLVQMRKPDEAIEVYQKAIAADPSFSWGYNRLGAVYAGQEEFLQALDWYRKAVEVEPEYYRALLDLGWVNLRLTRYGDALISLQKAVAISPNDPAGHAYLGRVLIELGREEEGVKELQTAVRLQPGIKDLPEFPKNKV